MNEERSEANTNRSKLHITPTDVLTRSKNQRHLHMQHVANSLHSNKIKPNQQFFKTNMSLQLIHIWIDVSQSCGIPIQKKVGMSFSISPAIACQASKGRFDGS